MDLISGIKMNREAVIIVLYYPDVSKINKMIDSLGKKTVRNITC